MRNFWRLLAAMILVAGSARAGDGRLEISQQLMPYVITNGGSYVVTENLSGSNASNGITIAASDVTLDLNGFTLSGVGGSLSGIAVSGNRVNLSIKQGVIRNWGIHGISAQTASNCAIQDVQVSNCGQDGILVGSGWTLFSCETADNGRDGLSAGDVCLLSSCLSRSNGRFGVLAGDFCLLEGVVSRENASVGIKVGQINLLAQASLRANRAAGIEMGQGTLLTDSAVHQNASNGVAVLGPGSKIQRTSAFGNNGFGLISWGAATFLEGSTFRNNTNGGVRLSSMSFALNNMADNSPSGPGFAVTGTATRLERNHATANQIGFSILGTNHVIVQNSGYRNSPTNFSFGSNSNFFEIMVNPFGSDSIFNEVWGSYDLF